MSSSGGRIPESFIELVLAKTDIVALIQEHVKLKKTGVNYSACCPFHNEKTPSFSVNQAKQFYHCFGCGVSGDAIRFLMDYQSLHFVDALERLAMRHGLSLPKDPEQNAKIQLKSTMIPVLNQAAEFYQHQLKQHQSASTAVAYLKKRGLTGVIAKTFGLGYAPPGWDNLLHFFNASPETLSILEEVGLIIKHPSGRYYDRFRDRIMFPIRDRRGDVCGFGARVLDKSQPKYLNSPDSPIFQKGHCLYGMYEVLHSKARWNMAIVVEGYLDVVSLSQLKVAGAVATLGTAITQHHLCILFSQVEKIVFCFDGDKAGKAAAWKALQLVFASFVENCQVCFVHLPQGEDPDSYVRQHGNDAFKAQVANSVPLSEYFFATLTEQIPLDSVDNRARLANLARPMIENLPKGIFKEMMFDRLAQIVASSPEVVRGEKGVRSYYRSKVLVKTKLAPAPMPIEPAIMASAILLRFPALSQGIVDQVTTWQKISAAGLELFLKLLNLLQNDPELTTSVLRDKLQSAGFELKRLEDCESKIALVPPEGIEAEFSGAIQRLEVIGRKQFAEKLLEKSKTTELTLEEKTQLKEFLKSRESII